MDQELTKEEEEEEILFFQTNNNSLNDINTNTAVTKHNY